ncbi:MAG TPA: hypothetical protein VN207_10705 [Ktedonobacteraceae bacterium]|nr:hypothetical protein [Ktedonobacteraceae bacterium]
MAEIDNLHATRLFKSLPSSGPSGFPFRPNLMTTYTSDTFKPLLNKLVQTPEYFSSDDLEESLNHVFTPNALHPAQIGAFLTALHVHRLERRPDYLATAAAVLRERALKATVEHPGDFVVDIVGTGGDGYNLFNVSTTAAVVAAGAGARVIKVIRSCLSAIPKSNY